MQTKRAADTLALLRAAKHGGRKLDTAIGRALGYTVTSWLCLTPWPELRRIDLPAWSSDLGAALTLAPGAGVVLNRYWRVVDGEWWSVRLAWGMDGSGSHADDCPSPALAVCIAVFEAGGPPAFRLAATWSGKHG